MKRQPCDHCNIDSTRLISLAVKKDFISLYGEILGKHHPERAQFCFKCAADYMNRYNSALAVKQGKPQPELKWTAEALFEAYKEETK